MGFTCEQAIQLVALCKTPMAYVGPDSKFVAINQAYAQILKAPEALIVGKTFTEWTFEEDIAHEVAMTKELAEGLRTSYEFVKRYNQRGSTPQRPQIVWGALIVQALWNSIKDEDGKSKVEFDGYLVTFEPLAFHQRQTFISIETIRESMKWLKSNWKTITAIIAIVGSLTGIAGPKLSEALHKLESSDTPELVGPSQSGPLSLPEP